MSPTRILWILIALVAAPGARGLDAVYLVRHADKVEEWPRELDRFRPLERAGIDRAERLAERFAGAGIAAVYTSSTTRTLATGMPLANAEKIPIAPDDRTIRSSKMKAFFRQVRKDHAGDRAVLVVGHSDTVPLLLMSLGAKEACFADLGVTDHGGQLLIDGYEGLWRVDLATPGCAGMKRQVLTLDD